MRAYYQSLFFHLGLLFALLLLMRTPEEPLEIPIELSEFKRVREATSTPHPRPKTSPPSDRIQSTQPTSQSTAQAGASATLPSLISSQSAPTEGVAEEYEVGELPTLLNEVRIPYPPSAKAKGIQGAVIFDLLIGSDGFVKSAKTVQSPSKELSDAAGIAVKKFRFRPAKIGDKAVAIQIRYTYRFVLE